MPEQIEGTTMPEEKSSEFNRGTAELVSILFKELASMSTEDIYNISFTKQEEGSPVLLEAINRTFDKFLTSGKDLPCSFFENYDNISTQFLHTFKLNIKGKLEENGKVLLSQTLGKKEEDISYTDIAEAVVPQSETSGTPEMDVSDDSTEVSSAE